MARRPPPPPPHVKLSPNPLSDGLGDGKPWLELGLFVAGLFAVGLIVLVLFSAYPPPAAVLSSCAGG